MTFFLYFLFYFIFFHEFIKTQTIDIVYKSNPIKRSSDDRIRIITQSCNYQHFNSNHLWKYMVALEPDVITLLGDTVYLDSEPCNDEKQNCVGMSDTVCDIFDCNKAADISCFNYCWAATTWYEDPMIQYNYLLNDTQFTLNKVYNRSTWPVPVFPIWDDHDYCKDNSNKSCQYKNLTRAAFVNFAKAIDQKEVLTNIINDLTENNDTGIFYYTDYNKTLSNNQILKLRFYMMDVRWYRTENDLFGTEQKSWFENLLLNNDISDINYHIFCSGTVYYPTFGALTSFAEIWPDSSKEWLKNVTSIANIRDRLIILTGDVHYSALYRENKTFEIVTSAMTHGIYDTQATILEEIQDDDGFLISNIIDIENIGVLDIGLNGFEFTYISQSGLPIANFSYNYTTNKTVYNLIQKNSDSMANFLTTKHAWIICIVASILYYW